MDLKVVKGVAKRGSSARPRGCGRKTNGTGKAGSTSGVFP